MAVKIEPGTAEAKERAKWEQFPTAFTDEDNPPGNRYVFREFPKMLYRAVVHNGKAVCMEPQPELRGGSAEAQAEHAYQMRLWEKRISDCTRIVRSEDEDRAAKHDGWRESPAAALAQHEDRERELFRAEAEAAHAATKMSSKAQAERDKREKATAGPLTE